MALIQKIDSTISNIRTQKKTVLVPEKAAQPGQDKPRMIEKTGRMPVRRVLYFQSQIDDIIDWAIDNSAILRRLLEGIPGTEPIVSTRQLLSRGLLHNFAHYLDGDGKIKKGDSKPGVCAPPVLFLKDFHIYDNGRRTHAALLNYFYSNPVFERSVLLVSSPIVLIPEGFEDRVELIRAPQIDREDAARLILRSLRERHALLSLGEDDPGLLELARRFKGLSSRQIEDVLYRVETACGVICELAPGCTEEERAQCRSITNGFIWDVKQDIGKKDGTLTYLKTDDAASAVGMDVYETWIRQRRNAFLKSYPNAPRGVTFVGVPGTGKTLMAKRTAQLLECELISFSLSSVKNSAYGSSGKNLEAKLNLFETQGQLVILIDEAEKDLPAKDANGGLGAHETTDSLMGILLRWMNDRKSPVFLMFTSNDISRTNKELLRPIRNDRVFFVGMPWRDELAAILQANLIDAQAKWQQHADFMAPEDVDAFKACQKNGQVHAACFDMVDALAGLIARTDRNLFFTGADVVLLINEATTRLTEEMDVAMPFSREDLTQAMCAIAEGPPFASGECSLHNIVRLYLQCAGNHYATVSSRSELVSVASLPAGSALPERSFDSEYDRQLYRRIGGAILKAKNG